MAKKHEEGIEIPVEVSETISEVTADFGRADLNEVVAKLNEVIRKING